MTVRIKFCRRNFAKSLRELRNNRNTLNDINSHSLIARNRNLFCGAPSWPRTRSRRSNGTAWNFAKHHSHFSRFRGVLSSWTWNSPSHVEKFARCKMRTISLLSVLFLAEENRTENARFRKQPTRAASYSGTFTPDYLHFTVSTTVADCRK